MRGRVGLNEVGYSEDILSDLPGQGEIFYSAPEANLRPTVKGKTTTVGRKQDRKTIGNFLLEQEIYKINSQS